MKLKTHEIYTYKAESLAYGGKAVGKIDGIVVFVPYAVPGDVLRIKITKVKKNYAEGKIEEIITSSPDRIEASCDNFMKCGGCKTLHMPYEKQLHWKEQQILDSLQRIGKVGNFQLLPIKPSPELYHYRNKMEFTFGSENGKTIIGFHEPGSWDKIIEVQKCLLHPEIFDEILQFVTDFVNERGISAYNPDTHEGVLRHLLLRYGRNTDEVLVVLMTIPTDSETPKELGYALKEKFPNLRGYLWGVNSGVADVARIDEEPFQIGDDFIYEQIGNMTFKVSAFSFFQTNTLGAEILYNTVREYAAITSYDKVLDAYCGTGTIGLYAAQQAQELYGIESVLDAVKNARENAKINNIQNAIFICDQMEKALLKTLGFQPGEISTVFIDPPRVGMHKRAMRSILALEAPQIIYISCNPTTLARDTQTICKNGYAFDSVQPVDMFPHTHHIECVIKFYRA